MELAELNLSEDQMAAITKMIQSEGDKVRTEYSRKNKELTEELEKYKPKPKSDAEKSLEERLKKLEDREAELSAKEKNVQIKDKLGEMGLPVGLADYLKLTNDDDIKKVGEELGNFFLENGSKPQNHNKPAKVTKEQFRAMSYSQRAELYNENPELYKILSK